MKKVLLCCSFSIRSLDWDWPALHLKRPVYISFAATCSRACGTSLPSLGTELRLVCVVFPWPRAKLAFLQVEMVGMEPPPSLDLEGHVFTVVYKHVES